MTIRSKKDVMGSIWKGTRMLGGKGRSYFEAYLGTDVKGRKIRVNCPAAQAAEPCG